MILNSSFAATKFSRSLTSPVSTLAARLIIIFGLCASSAIASAQAVGDQQQALKIFRETYNGSFVSDVEGSARSAIADDKLVVEFGGDIAKSLLYNIPDAKDQVQWIPRDGGSSWTNYYVRIGASVVCGHGSYDLLADPFPRLRCRLTVSTNGTVNGFADRTKGKSEFHDSKFVDLFYGDLSGSVGASNTYNFMKNDSPQSVAVQVFGKVALDIYNQMTEVKEVDDSMGPVPVKMKNGQQIWCAKMTSPDGFSDDPEKSVKCRIALNSNGTAIKDQ